MSPGFTGVMKAIKGRVFILSALSVSLAALCSSQSLAQDIDPEWPCIQQLVAVVSPAVMWPLPVDDEMMNAWSNDSEVRPLAERLGDLAEYSDDERLAVETFAGAIPEDKLEERLSLLAAGVVDVTNRVRTQYIGGIKRYTRQQIAIANQIEGSLNELSDLEGAEDAASAEKKETILQTLRWHERVYDQREQAIRLLCEEPVELEQRMSDVLRDLAQYLP